MHRTTFDPNREPRHRVQRPTDVTEEQLRLIEPMLVGQKEVAGRKLKTDWRKLLNAILLHLRGGVPWRDLPQDLQPWGSSHSALYKWRKSGLWNRIKSVLGDDPELSQGEEKSFRTKPVSMSLTHAGETRTILGQTRVIRGSP